MKRSISGIKPTGQQPHIGNYLGMMKKTIDLQNTHDNMVFIADLHGLTTVHDPKAMKENTFEAALEFLSLGLDPEKTVLFRQSDVPEHTELSWIFACLTGMGLLERAHAYKDAVAKGKVASVGLFTYPVLMAADILIYKNNVVPVGKDQIQHVEIARDIAEKFNHTFGELFPLPEALVDEETQTIVGTDGQKMSKSYNNTIMLFEDEEAQRKQLMGYQTDPARIHKDDLGHPEDCPAFALHKLFSQNNIATIDSECRAGQRGCVACKKELTENVMDYFAPFRAKRAELLKNPDYIYEVLATGGKKARALATETIEEVRRRVGFR